MRSHRPEHSCANTADDLDTRMMKRAIALSRKGEGRVEPNPMVGCVIVRAGRIIAEGYHRRFGGPHAEVQALRQCPHKPRGATVYVSLEPCCHQGRTPPCTEALIEAGVKRVVVALRDPNPAVHGRGIRQLYAAGVAVDVGLMDRESAEVLAPFITYTKSSRPFVIAKWAQSLDGKLATRTGQSKWISCEESRRRVHRLRARVDAILVGSQTVKADDPLLTARDVPLKRRAARVVLDGRLRISEKCRLVNTADEIRTLVVTTAKQASTPKAKRLARKGIEIIACRRHRGHLALEECLAGLARRDVTNLLVEGGPTVLTALLEAELVDEAMVFIAPKLIGGRNSPTVLGGWSVERVDQALSPRSVHTQKSGVDTLHRLRFTDPLALAKGRRESEK
ncbi:MAG: bifunctional diaminohydroxyphosphoribosylaminopyrimidine deaminase/5-amino-6-(5-phosphoribosylamino)uracil reductase RibD [Phycisphaerales bacterium]|nr:MAG: bifunctional diaminohydroxyphosphoribosylaminopyrimidine deaminase/5-amino-6-(5-phosphoribosylamino)uracil reductase RibD [Phycisphaerales bacterium]